MNLFNDVGMLRVLMRQRNAMGVPLAKGRTRALGMESSRNEERSVASVQSVKSVTLWSCLAVCQTGHMALSARSQSAASAAY